MPKAICKMYGDDLIMNDHTACIILNMLNGFGGISAWKSRGSHVEALLKACGSISAVFELNTNRLSRIEGVSIDRVERISRWRELVNLDRELETAKNNGVTIICRTDHEYPDSLRKLRYPPLCIYVLGIMPADLDRESIAIVGTRSPTDFGIRMARKLSQSAASVGWTTVSGLASGIDTVAHQTTLAAGGRTVAVLGSGLAKVHPESIELMRDIVQFGGAVVSEYPMNTETTRYTLPRRNRIIAALSSCTLVIEASDKSGALITAANATELEHHVFAVPGDEDNPLATGCSTLVRQGAKPVTDFSDIINDN